MQVVHRKPIFVPYGGDDSDLYLPSIYEISVEDERLPYSLKLHVRVLSGRPECELLVATQKEGDEQNPGGPPVTGEGLRRLPLARILQQSTVYAARPLSADETFLKPEIDDANDAYAAWRESEPRARHRVSREELAKVAEVYRKAVEAGDPPTKTVREVLHLSRATAGRRVMETRSAGLLPKTEQRRAKA